MLEFLLNLIPNIFKVWLGMKSSEAESLGKVEQKTFDDKNSIKSLQEMNEAASNAPQDKTEMEKLLENGKFAISLFCLFLASCSDCAMAYPCVPVRKYTDVEQMNLKADLEQLPNDSMLVQAMLDYDRMRQQSKACTGE